MTDLIESISIAIFVLDILWLLFLSMFFFAFVVFVIMILINASGINSRAWPREDLE